MLSIREKREISEQFISYAVLAVIFISPFMLGGTGAISKLFLCSLLLLLTIGWLSIRLLLKREETLKFPLLGPAIAFALIICWQLLPLPQTVLALISPYSHYLKIGLAQESGINITGWHCLSIAPQASFNSLLFFCSYYALFILLFNKFKSKSFSRHTFNLMLALAAIFSTLAICQKLSATQAIYWHFPSSAPFYGTFFNPNHAAAFIALLLIFIFVSSLGLKKKGTIFSSNLIVALSFIALLYSLSRGAILSFFISAIFLFAVVIKARLLKLKNNHKVKKKIIIALLSFFCASLILLSWLGLREVPGELATLKEGQLTQFYRYKIWLDSLPIFYNFPLFGSGLGSFSQIYPSFQTLLISKKAYFAENDLLQFILENGLLGLTVLGYFMIKLIKVGKKLITKERANYKSLAALFALFFFFVNSLVNFNLAIPPLSFLALIFLAYFLREEGQSVV